MTRSLLIRGMLVGIVAGLCLFVFARIFGEPSVDAAIALEEHAHSHAGEAGDEVELVSRGVQAGWGLFTATVVYGAAVGGIFSLVFAFCHGRLGKLSPRATALLIAVAGFVAIVLVPQLKYPGNPPAVGHPETIGIRTAVYFGMMVISVGALIAAINLRRGLVERWGGWNAAIAAGVAYLVVVAAAGFVLPTINEVPEGFPASLLWDFRIATLGMHALLWAVLGLGFGVVAERLLSRRGVAVGTARAA